jgi:hypothetical protein
VKIVEDKQYKGMFWLQWEDGSQSCDFYNKNRARYHISLSGVQELAPGAQYLDRGSFIE